jgi:hypothetical protein
MKTPNLYQKVTSGVQRKMCEKLSFDEAPERDVQLCWQVNSSHLWMRGLLYKKKSELIVTWKTS